MKKMSGRLSVLFGEDWEDAVDSLKAAPGALGNVAYAVLRQFRVIDLAAMAIVITGWGWMAYSFGGGDSPSLTTILVALLPTALWLACGAAGALIFEVSGLGYRSLVYWESYLIILVVALFGTASLRLALQPKGARVYRAAPK